MAHGVVSVVHFIRFALPIFLASVLVDIVFKILAKLNEFNAPFAVHSHIVDPFIILLRVITIIAKEFVARPRQKVISFIVSDLFVQVLKVNIHQDIFLQRSHLI